MGYLDPYVLPADTRVAPLSGFRAAYLAEIGAGADEFIVTRPRSRLPSTVIDARTAALLERFREPRTIVDAVIELGRAEGVDPRSILDDAAEMVRRFADEGVLALAGSPFAAPIIAELGPGDRLGDIEVLEPVQVLVDIEVHRGRAADGTAVAVKLARAAAPASARAALVHEVYVLDRLGGDVGPELVAYGDRDGRPWIATRWCEGVDAAGAAAALRGTEAGPGALLRLADAVLDAYCRLHARGVVHGDVHPRNLVVDRAGTVTVLDFGTAVLAGSESGDQAGGRPGVDLYAEPEVAEAALAGAPLPAPTAVGEQYALGVLVYVLLVGDHPHGFTADPRELLRRILKCPPSFDHWWGPVGVEHVIRRALRPRPGDRHASTAAMLDAFRAAIVAPPEAGGSPAAGPASRSTARDGLLTAVLDRLAPKGGRFERPPAADPTVMHGLAGRAWAVLRCAESLGDPELLAVADLWAAEAAAAELPDRASLLYGAAGVHAVRVAVARARADEAERAAALAAFADAASEPSAGADVTHGRAGLLLGCCAMLADATPGERRLLAALGNRLADGLDAEVTVPYGVAHGTAGRLLALTRWTEATGVRPGDRLTTSLDALAGAVAGPAPPRHRDLAGAGRRGAHPLMASWCNGAAGLVHLWLAAYRTLGGDRWERLARQAGRTVEQGPDARSGDLCCGLGGGSYALLALYRATGDVRWLESGRRLADGAAEVIRRVRPDVRDSLYAGEPGVAALAADLAHPADARMPLVDH